VRLAKDRSTKFLKYFKLLDNLVSGYTYELDPELAKDLLDKFQQEFQKLEAAWTAAVAKAEKKSKKDEPETESEDSDAEVAETEEAEA